MATQPSGINITHPNTSGSNATAQRSATTNQDSQKQNSTAPVGDLGSGRYHVPLHESARRLQGLPLVTEERSITLSRISATTDQFLRVPKSERVHVTQPALRRFDGQQYVLGADRYSLRGSEPYTDSSSQQHPQQPGTALTLNRRGPNELYSHTSLPTYMCWRDKVPFVCPVRHPELMSYDPLLINSQVLGLTRDAGMRNTAGLCEGRQAEDWSMMADRGVTEMSLRKHSIAHRMSSWKTYPGLGGSNAAGDRPLDPYIAGYAMAEGDHFGASISSGTSSRSSQLAAMGISGFAPPTPAASKPKGPQTLRNSSGTSSGKKYPNYIAEQREDEQRKASASLFGAIGSTYGTVTAQERQAAAGNASQADVEATSAPTSSLSKHWYWVNADPTAKFLVHDSQQRFR